MIKPEKLQLASLAASGGGSEALGDREVVPPTPIGHPRLNPFLNDD